MDTFHVESSVEQGLDLAFLHDEALLHTQIARPFLPMRLAFYEHRVRRPCAVPVGQVIYYIFLLK